MYRLKRRNVLLPPRRLKSHLSFVIMQPGNHIHDRSIELQGFFNALFRCELKFKWHFKDVFLRHWESGFPESSQISPFWSKFIVLQGWKLRVDAPKIGVWASLSLIRASLEWINNENWTEWSAIWAEIIRVISKSNRCAALVRFEITNMISGQNCTTRGSVTTLLYPFWNRPNKGLG